MASAAGEMTIDDAWEYTKAGILAAWSRTTRRMRAAAGLMIFMYVFDPTHVTKEILIDL